LVEPLYALAQVIYDFMESGPMSVLMLVYLMAAAIPVTLVHELGHAVVGRRRLGGEVAVSVGTTGRIAELRLAQIKVSINALSDPTRAGGRAVFDAQRATARDVVAIALAGPLASLAGTLVSGWLLSMAPAGVVYDFLWAMTLGGVCACVANLIPLKLEERRGEGLMRTDGMLVVEALRVMRITHGPALDEAAERARRLSANRHTSRPPPGR
jgi:hypothetical protein